MATAHHCFGAIHNDKLLCFVDWYGIGYIPFNFGQNLEHVLEQVKNFDGRFRLMVAINTDTEVKNLILYEPQAARETKLTPGQ